MNNQDYLDQISQSTSTMGIQQKSDTSPSSLIGSLFSSPLMKIVLGVIVLTIITIIVGLMMSNSNDRTADLTKQLSLRLTNLSSMIQTYNPNVKSSNLRSVGTNFNSTLNGVKTKVDEYLLNTYNYKAKDGDTSASFAQEEQTLMNDIKTELDKAKINAVLDPTYARTLATQLELLMSLQSEIKSRTNNDSLNTILEDSNNDLVVVKNKLNNILPTIK